jgi:hypothetical protein
VLVENRYKKILYLLQEFLCFGRARGPVGIQSAEQRNYPGHLKLISYVWFGRHNIANDYYIDLTTNT